MSPEDRPRRRRRSTKGTDTRQRIYAAALDRFRRDGFERATMRAIAADAGVTPGLAYRYFDSKQALVAELYGRSLEAWVARADSMPPGRWTDRTLWLTRTAMEVLEPHRLLLRALLGPMLAGDPVASPLHNPSSLEHGPPLFLRAIAQAEDAPKDAAALADAAHLGQLALLFFWAVDRSPGQRATRSLLAALEGLGPFLALGLKTPFVRPRLLALAGHVRDGLLGDEPPPVRS